MLGPAKLRWPFFLQKRIRVSARPIELSELVMAQADARNHGSAFFACHLIMPVVLIGGHRFFSTLLPGAIVFRKFAKRACHLANMDGHRSATGANVIDADLACIPGIICHLVSRELQAGQVPSGNSGRLVKSGVSLGVR